MVHTRWKDGILAYHIIDIQHQPGTSNTAADGLSCGFMTRERVEGDGSNWTVSEDWEESRGIVQDLLAIESSSQVSTTNMDALQLRFANEPLFLEVIDAIHNLDSDKTIKEKRRARHRA